MNQDILTDIIAHKRKEIAIQEAAVSASFLENHIGGTTVTRSMKQSLTTSSTGIIAEFKRRSPSKGWINCEADASIVPHNYELAEAAALSILTDELFFGGSLKDIRNARPTVNIPVLRKDFIISRYQLLQAKVAQADAVLLIAAALSKDECMSLAKEAHALQLEVLLEIHTEQETDYINEYVDMIESGIIDPTKVTRSALQNAASVAATLLTTEAVVVEVEDKTEKAAQPEY